MMIQWEKDLSDKVEHLNQHFSWEKGTLAESVCSKRQNSTCFFYKPIYIKKITFLRHKKKAPMGAKLLVRRFELRTVAVPPTRLDEIAFPVPIREFKTPNACSLLVFFFLSILPSRRDKKFMQRKIGWMGNCNDKFMKSNTNLFCRSKSANSSYSHPSH